MTEESKTKEWGDKWSDQAKLYSDQAARLTELHGADLITLLKKDILQAKTILDVGSGTGAFAKAYIQQFPNGISGQTLILSDLAAGMLAVAKETVKTNDDFQTKILFQEEDGTKLEGIADDSVDLVVSLFGVFLIPDQEGACAAIRRVLKKPNGVVAIVSWQFDISSTLALQGFGVGLQDAFVTVVRAIKPGGLNGPEVEWADGYTARKILSEKYKMDSVGIFSALHSTVWEFDYLWMMLCKNPMSNIQQASESDAEKAKNTLIQLLTEVGNHSIDKPLILSTASNLCIGRGISSS